MLLPSFCPGIEMTYYTCGSSLKVKKRLLFTISEWAIVPSLSLSLFLFIENPLLFGDGSRFTCPLDLVR
jgi:hypothetical protein